jgi:predicted RNA binding protein YcfA (HicA-like mRNA interferase family)
MLKLPQVSGRDLVRLLQRLGYEWIRQRGSHVRLRLVTPRGTHFITIPMHPIIAKGTLNDILKQVSLWTGLSKEELLKRLRETA